MSNDVALPSGALLLPQDRDARSTLAIGCASDGTGGTPIGVGAATNPTAWEIFRCNDLTNRRMRWSAAAGGNAAARIVRLRDDPFTAQTTLAASYGLLQMTFRRLVSEKWPGVGGAINPSFMFDTAANLEDDAGSLRVGTRSLRTALVRRQRRAGGQFPPERPSALLEAFIQSWRLDYNPGERDYGAIIGLMAETFRPITSNEVFQQ